MADASPIDLSERSRRPPGRAAAREQVVFDVDDLSVLYGDFRAVQDVTIDVHQHEITAFIGPSGCGKTTVLRCFNRMNDFIETAKVEGTIIYHGVNLYDSRRQRHRGAPAHRHGVPEAEPVPQEHLRQRRLRPAAGRRQEEGRARRRSSSGRCAAPRCGTRSRTGSRRSGLGLSGGQQQRLCIARAIAVEPEVILMDEPCSALDPIATARIEELMQEIKTKYTIVIVTHNMQQAARVSDRTAFFTTEINPESDRRTGRLVEYNPTTKIFSNPDDERTEQYVTGRFG